MSKEKEIILPVVDLAVNGDVFGASGSEPTRWDIRAEAETDTSARTRIVLDGDHMADITIHAPCREKLVEEVQEVAAGLLWSAIRAWYYRKEMAESARPARAIEIEMPDRSTKLCDVNFEPGRVYTCPDSDFVYAICFDDKHFTLLVSKGETGTGDRIFRIKRLPRDEKRVRLFNLYHYQHQRRRG